MLECTDAPFFDGPGCLKHEHHLSPKVIPSDYNKDFLLWVDDNQAWSTRQITCGKKTILLAPSNLNGRLTCVELKNETIRNVDWWRAAIYQLYSEPHDAMLDNLDWRYDRKVLKEFKTIKGW